MNDRFKFRFYDNDKEIMIDENSDYATIKTIYGQDEWWWCVEAGMPTVLDYFEQQSWDGSRNFVIMQCTGLKDKNGKLIYEGDIVKTSKGIANVEYDNTYAYFGLTTFLTVFSFDNFINEEYEVIGNIYENPELLEEERIIFKR